MIKFYGRESELEALNENFLLSKKSAQMSIILGRRRIGKTLLSLEFAKKSKHLYLFISKKSESLLCEEFVQKIEKTYSKQVIGEITSFKQIFSLIIEISKQKSVTLILDEFQEFYKINPSIYSEIQALWDLNKATCRLNLILIGSIYSLMYKIFQHFREPLFGRVDSIIHLKPFSIKVLKQILSDYSLTKKNLVFDYFVFTGGMPKYVELLSQKKANSQKKIVNTIIKENSLFLSEGKNLLIEEFGRNYTVYFSILELISVGKTSRNEISSIIKNDIGGYLERLEKDYSIIKKYKPINAKANSRNQKYEIVDNFLKFWFRFIFKNRSALESGNLEYIKQDIWLNYSVYCGRMLEKYFIELFKESKKYNRIGSYWERGNKNEIDLVAINDQKKIVVIAEVKLNEKKINIEKLKQKAKKLILSFKDYKISYIGLSLGREHIV